MAKIASYPETSLADARKRFREDYAPAISAGVDPARKSAARLKGESDESLRALFEAYVADLRARRRRTAEQAERILLADKTGAAAWIGAKRPASSVGAEDILPFLKSIHDRGVPVAADRARAWLSAAFSFGIKGEHDYTKSDATAHWGIKVNPVAAIKADASAKRTVDRFLSPEELRAWWHWLDARREVSLMASGMMILFATGSASKKSYPSQRRAPRTSRSTGSVSTSPMRR
jgi:hypothetical protein